jgi:putative heme-binding domain-containing protein
MVYLGDNWPESYRHSLLTCILHGIRLNLDLLDRRGSGYVAHHGRDFLLAHDPWFRGISVQYGPDGGVFVSDWTDTGECHNYKVVDRSNGRIFKVTYGKAAPYKEDLSRLSDADLVRRQLHRNDWHVRHARRLLQERAALGKLDPATHGQLRAILRDHPDVTRKLRALWALHVTGGVAEKLLFELLESPHEALRGWAIQLGLEGRGASMAFREKLAEMARKDSSPFVRLYLASGLQRLPLDQRWPIAGGLILHGEDAQDAYLPLMIWYGMEALVPADMERTVDLIARAKIPLEREYLARRVASLPAEPVPPGLPPLVRLLQRVADPDVQLDVLRGIQAAFEGQREVPMPAGWQDVARKLAQSPRADVRERALIAAVLFGDREAVTALRKLVVDPTAAAPAREKALEALLSKKDPSLVPVLQALVSDKALRGPAIRGLAVYHDVATPRVILQVYLALTEAEKTDAIQTLTSRPPYALALLDAVEHGTVSRTDLSAFTVRQLMGLKDSAVADKLRKVWGTIRPASREKAELMARYKALLTPDNLQHADRSHGRALFARTCASCHRLFGEGGTIGPELTGSQRANLDYILENILDPSAVVAKDYQVTLIATNDGRLITGIIKQETDKAVSVQTQNEVVLVPRNEIESRTSSRLSMMPEGLLAPLKNDEVRDLIGYLAGPTQVPLLK